MAGAALLVGCNKEVDQGPASLDVKTSELNLTSAETTEVVTFVATRDWVVSGIPDWMNASDESGVASDKEQSITLYVDENTGYDRKASIVITIGFARSVISVNQAGPEGEKGEGTGTLEDPYTVAGAVAYVRELGADVESPQKVFVKGIISNVETTFEASGTYGNATFDLVDEGNASLTFKAFQTYYLGNVKWTAGENNPDVKAGDEVILYGTIYNYRGNTPETTGKGTSFIYSLNGVNRGGIDGGQGGGEETPDETLEPASDTNIAGLVAKISPSSTSNSKSTYDGITLAGATVTYVNGGSVYLEDNSGAVLLYMQNSGLVAGDVISGPVSGEGYYFNGLPEITSLGDAYTKASGNAPAPTEMTIERLLSTYTSQLSRYIILKDVTVTTGMESRKAVVAQGENSINVYAALKEGLKLEKDATGDIIVFPTLYNTTKQVSFWDNSHFTGNGQVTPPTPGTHDGLTPETAFTASEAHAWVLANITGNNNTGDTKYYVTGTIQRFYQREGADQNFTNNSYKQASFFITDDGNASENEFEAYQINYLNGDTFADGNTDVKVGDVVMVYGPLARYNDVTETAGKGAAYLYSLNGQGGGTTPGGGDVTPGAAGTYSFQFTDVTGLSWPTAKGAGASTQVYPLDGVNYTFTLSDNIYTSTYNGASYLMLASKTAAGPVYLGLPALEGLKLVKVTVKTSSGASKSAHGVITSDQNGTVVAGGEDKPLSELDTEYTWNLTGTEAGKVYYYSSPTSGYNSQIVKLDLTYSDGEGSGDNPGGDEPTTNLPVNDGLTEETAFTVEDAVYVAKNGTEDKEYFVKAVVGKDINIKNGVATFELMDGTTNDKLTVIKAKSFGGAAFEGTEPMEWMDEVILKGKVGTTNALPTLTAGTLVKWNGKTSFTETPATGHDGLTLETAFTASEANAWIMEKFTSNGNTGNDKYYVKGKIVRMYQNNGKDQNFTNNSYKQATFFITDDGNSGTEFEAYQINYLGGAAFAEGNTDVKVGDEVVIYGPLARYNTTAETNGKGTAYLYSLNGETQPKSNHDGLTLENAFTASEANAWIMANISGNTNTGNTKYYVKGKISRMYQSNGKDQNFTNNSYKQASFFITDDGNSGTEFEAYQINYLGGAAFAEGNTDVKVGDEVVIYGPLAKYNTIAETAGKGAAYLYSLNGKTTDEGSNPGGGGGTTSNDPVTITFAEQNLANAQEITSLTVGAITITGEKGSNSNTPKYYTSGTAVRFYGGNSFTLTSSGNKIAKVEFTFASGEGTNEITADVGTFQSPVWTGSAQAVKFTIGGTSGQRRISKIVVTFE